VSLRLLYLIFVRVCGRVTKQVASAGISRYPAVAEAIEDALGADGPGQMDSSLHALAAVDHGPVIRGKLLVSWVFDPPQKSAE